MAKKPRATGLTMIGFLTYNVQYGKKIEEIYDWIIALEYKPNIICFQEFPQKEIRNIKKIKIFENTGLDFAKSFEYENKQLGELTIFDQDKIKLLKSKKINLGNDFIETKLRKDPVTRSAILTEFEIGNLKITIANLHLTPVSLNNKRRNQLFRVIGKIKNDKAIIAGDFNYPSIVGRKGLINFMEKHGYRLAGENLITHRYQYVIPQQLDYVFYKGLVISEAKVIPLPYSDHYPVIAKLKID